MAPYHQMVQYPTGSPDQEVYALDELVGFVLPVRSAHDDPKCLSMVLHQLPRDVEYLEGELPCWRDDHDTGTYARPTRAHALASIAS